MIEHHLKIVDFYISIGCPENFLIEPVLGKYEPDVLFQNKTGKNICVEIQITPISAKKMQAKIDSFVKEYKVNHDSRTLVICTNIKYKIKTPDNFSVLFQNIPDEICL